MTSVKKLHEKWSKDAGYQSAYASMAEEFDLAGAIIAARKSAGLTQKQLAESLETTQSAVSRLESGADSTTVKTLQRIAGATGTQLKISFER